MGIGAGQGEVEKEKGGGCKAGRGKKEKINKQGEIADHESCVHTFAMLTTELPLPCHHPCACPCSFSLILHNSRVNTELQPLHIKHCHFPRLCSCSEVFFSRQERKRLPIGL